MFNEAPSENHEDYLGFYILQRIIGDYSRSNLKDDKYSKFNEVLRHFPIV